MTTAARRARKKANHKGKLERLAQILEKIDALADEDLVECERPERPESEKAAAMSALAVARKMRKKLQSE